MAYLSASENDWILKQKQERNTKQKQRILIAGVIVALLIAGGAIALTTFAIRSKKEANKATSEAIRSRLIADSLRAQTEKNFSSLKNAQDSLTAIIDGLSVKDSFAKVSLTAIQRRLQDDIEGNDQNKNYCVIIGSHKSLDDAKAQQALLSKRNVPYNIQIYKNEKNIYAVCLDGQQSDANERLSYAIENLKIHDAYKKDSRLLQKIE